MVRVVRTHSPINVILGNSLHFSIVEYEKYEKKEVHKLPTLFGQYHGEECWQLASSDCPIRFQEDVMKPLMLYSFICSHFRQYLATLLNATSSDTSIQQLKKKKDDDEEDTNNYDSTSFGWIEVSDEVAFNKVARYYRK